MRILFLSDQIPPENRGGAGIVTWRLASQLHSMGHDVHVIASTAGEPFEEIREGIPTYHIHVDYPERFHAYLSLYNPQVNAPIHKLYRRIQPDVINAHNIHRNLTYHSMQIAHDERIPLVFSSHDVMPFAYHKMRYFINPQRCTIDSPMDYRLPPLFNLKQMRFRYNPFRNLTIRRILKHYAQIRTAPSQALCDAHHANDLPEFNCVHNGIDVNQFTVSDETVQTLKDRLELNGRKVILFAGRLTEAKGTQQLLSTLNIVVQNQPDTTLLVLSSVPVEEQIQTSQFAGLRDNHIRTAGWLEGEELSAAFHLSHVTVVPSVIFDTFPTVNLEAMVSHSLVLATCFGGSREAVIDSETGYIINPYQIEDFADKLTLALADNALRKTMTTKAFERINSLFTLQMQAEKMLALYRKAIDTF